ncbi:GNAT family N-acetyltransferase [Paracoccaceae bacterium Fryx2]|nr:GNAT family N-acetyltransferase [Paracoccaceae bacterium Fryx2]
MTPTELDRVMEATWPAAARWRVGPWTVRDGQGGGKRVSAATADGAWLPADIAGAEAAMQALGQDCLFMIRDGDGDLDAALAARGYRIVDPVVAYAAPCAALAHPAPDPMEAFAHWPPLGIATDLWAAGGIGPARLAVMLRVAGPRTAILARVADRPAGVGFVALAGQTAMLHALEVPPRLRRQGSANIILRASANWALQNGATTLSLVVTAANSAARNLYASLGMQPVGQYHYRQK